MTDLNLETRRAEAVLCSKKKNIAGWKGNNHKYVDQTGMTNESSVFARADLFVPSLSGRCREMNSTESLHSRSVILFNL